MCTSSRRRRTVDPGLVDRNHGYVLTMSSIVIIEDDPAIRSAVQRAMTERGHAVAVAAGGLSGLES